MQVGAVGVREGMEEMEGEKGQKGVWEGERVCRRREGGEGRERIKNKNL